MAMLDNQMVKKQVIELRFWGLVKNGVSLIDDEPRFVSEPQQCTVRHVHYLDVFLSTNWEE